MVWTRPVRSTASRSRAPECRHFAGPKRGCPTLPLFKCQFNVVDVRAITQTRLQALHEIGDSLHRLSEQNANHGAGPESAIGSLR